MTNEFKLRKIHSSTQLLITSENVEQSKIILTEQKTQGLNILKHQLSSSKEEMCITLKNFHLKRNQLTLTVKKVKVVAT